MKFHLAMLTSSNRNISALLAICAGEFTGHIYNSANQYNWYKSISNSHQVYMTLFTNYTLDKVNNFLRWHSVEEMIIHMIIRKWSSGNRIQWNKWFPSHWLHIGVYGLFAILFLEHKFYSYLRNKWFDMGSKYIESFPLNGVWSLAADYIIVTCDIALLLCDISQGKIPFHMQCHW